MKTVVANGVALNVLDMTPPETAPPLAPPVVMLHGLLIGSVASWYFSSARPLAKRRRVILYDLRGHGRSARPREGYDVGTMAEDLHGLIAALDPPLAATPDIVGHSWGALVALEYARRYPHGLRRLALVEPPIDTAEAGALTEVLRKGADEVGETLLAALPPSVRSDFDPARRRGRKRVEALAAFATETTLFEDIEARATPDDAALAAVTAPVLALFGDASPCRASAARLGRVIPHARVETLPGGHFLPLDAPREVSRRLEEFLDG